MSSSRRRAGRSTRCPTARRRGSSTRCSAPGPDRVPALLMAILTKRLTFRGFIVSDFAAQFPQFLADMSAWLKEGRIKYREDVTAGLENAPRELIGLLRGENFGKKIIRVGPAPAGR